MNIQNQLRDQENDGLVEYLRLKEILHLKRPTEELKTAICFRWILRAIEKGKNKKNKIVMLIIYWHLLLFVLACLTIVLKEFGLNVSNLADNQICFRLWF
jgi:hypothetical protein